MRLGLLSMFPFFSQIITSPLSLAQQLSLYNSSNLARVGEVHCLKTSNPLSLRATPVYEDCLSAIAKLPHSSVVGSFHNSGPNDLYKLPITRASGTCAVMVHLNTGRGATTASAWTSIALGAIKVNVECVSTFRFSRKTGGWTDLGAQGPAYPPGPDDPFPVPYEIGRIQVSLFHPSRITDPMNHTGSVNGTLEQSILQNISIDVEAAT